MDRSVPEEVDGALLPEGRPVEDSAGRANELHEVMRAHVIHAVGIGYVCRPVELLRGRPIGWQGETGSRTIGHQPLR